MKKKIKIPKGFEVTKVIDHSKSENPRINVKLKKIEKPEYIRVIDTDEPEALPLNHVFPLYCEDDIYYYFSYYGYKNDEGWYKERFETATKADYEAHKIGFHVGDEVWFNEKESDLNRGQLLGCIKEIRFYKNGELEVDAGNWEGQFIKYLTKTPPKQPIFKIDGKDMFEGDEYPVIDKEDNWRLRDFTTHKKTVPVDSELRPRFTTKQSALDYVLKEAKERFEGKTLTAGLKKHVSKKVIYDDEHDEIRDDFYWLWNPSDGFNANVDVVKEPNLMLGNEAIQITSTKHCESSKLRGLKDSITISCKGRSVTKEEWMEWYGRLTIVWPHIKEATMNLGVHDVLILRNDISLVRIGCIEKITIDQIEAITNKLKEL